MMPTLRNKSDLSEWPIEFSRRNIKGEERPMSGTNDIRGRYLEMEKKSRKASATVRPSG